MMWEPRWDNLCQFPIRIQVGNLRRICLTWLATHIIGFPGKRIDFGFQQIETAWNGNSAILNWPSYIENTIYVLICYVTYTGIMDKNVTDLLILSGHE